MATAAAAVSATRMSSIYPTDYDVNNTDGPDRINTDGIIEVLRPKSNDIIMGKGQWNKFHPGNIAFKLSLNNEREQYELANRFERMRVVDRMLNELLGIKKHLGGKTSTPSTPLSPSSSVAAEICNNDGGGARFLYKEKKKKITTATSSDTASNDTAQEARTNHSEDNNHRDDNNKNDDDKQQQQQYNMKQQHQYEQQQQQLLSLLFEAGPWLIATREKAHDKITHDFRNMRRQTQLQLQQQQQQQHFL